MYTGCYTVQVQGFSSQTKENDLYDFFSHCGSISHIEIIRSNEGDTATAYITFTNSYANDTALLLSGAIIADRRVSVAPWDANGEQFNDWGQFPARNGQVRVSHMVATPGEAVTVAQRVVVTMIAKGYNLGKDALAMAKGLDESHGISSAATSRIVDLGTRVGLTEKIVSGLETARYVDGKYHVSYYTKQAASFTGHAAVSAAVFTGRTASAAATAFVNSSYFAKGALWVSDVLSRASHAAAELGHKNVN